MLDHLCCQILQAMWTFAIWLGIVCSMPFYSYFNFIKQAYKSFTYPCFSVSFCLSLKGIKQLSVCLYFLYSYNISLFLQRSGRRPHPCAQNISSENGNSHSHKGRHDSYAFPYFWPFSYWWLPLPIMNNNHPASWGLVI